MGAREDGLYEKWLRWLERIADELVHLATDRDMYRDVGEITKAADLPPSYFFDATNRWFAQTQAMAVRRQTEVAEDSASLATLLDQIARHPEVLTRARYTGLYDNAEHWQARANASFDGLAGVGADTILPERITADLDRLREAAKPVKAYVDRLVAHHDRRELTELPSFAELNDAIDVVLEVFKEWNQWLTAAVWVEMVGAFQYDWKAPFRVAWLTDGQ